MEHKSYSWKSGESLVEISKVTRPLTRRRYILKYNIKVSLRDIGTY